MPFIDTPFFNLYQFVKKFLLSILVLMVACSLQAQGKYVGGDISDLPLYEKHNSAYLDAKGNKINDLITWLVNDCGWNTFRVRLFVNPNGKSNDGKSVDPSVCQDIEYVKALGKRIKAAGAYFVLDFHYSDTWVDATHIQAPAAWASLSVSEMAKKVGEYTEESLQALIDAGAKPDMVQVGNEIMYGMVGIKVAPYNEAGTNWNGFLEVMKAGCSAVRNKCPQAQIIIHTDRPANANYANFWYGNLDKAGVEYDVIGLSYYPFWHGFLSDLKSGLDNLKKNFPNKKVQIVETGYYFQYWPSSGVNSNTTTTWPATEKGQYQFVKDLISCLADYPQVEGLYYWCPEDAGNGDDTDWSTSKGTVMTSWTNRGLWWPSASANGHWPVTCSEGDIHHLLKNFISDSHIFDLKSDMLHNKGPIFDVIGKKVETPVENEIYLLNGKKAIFKK